MDLLGNCWSWNLACRAANTFNNDVIQPINRDVIRPVAYFVADFGHSVWHLANELAQGIGNVFTGLIRGIGCIGSFGSPIAGTCNNAAANQINQGSGQILRGSAGLCLDLCPVKGGRYLAKIPFIGRAIDRFGNWIKPGETAAQRTARYAAESGSLDVVKFADKAAARQGLDGDLQTASNRFFRDATSKSQDFQITKLRGGNTQMQFFSPANNPGYGKLYVQTIDSSGQVVTEYKDTLVPNGLIERKWIHGARDGETDWQCTGGGACRRCGALSGNHVVRAGPALGSCRWKGSCPESRCSCSGSPSLLGRTGNFCRRPKVGIVRATWVRGRREW